MLRRLRQAAAIIRPSAVAQLASRLTRLTTDHHTLATQARQHIRATERALQGLTRHAERDRGKLLRQAETQAAQTARLADLTAQVAALQETVRRLSTRTDHLTVATERLTADDDVSSLIDGVLDVGAVQAHVRSVLDRTPLESDPYPHMVLDNLLPSAFYKALIDTMPPRALFDEAVNKEQLRVPPRGAGLTTFRIWRFLVAEILESQLQDALLARFREPLTEYARRFWPSANLDDLRLGGSDGRIILRQRGYVIPPHRDPKWAWLTFILYLAKPGDPDTWGTQLYRVNDDVEAPGAQPFWMGSHDHVLAKDVRFLPNRALVFLNADGSHGASIPEDAPADFERYIYQFRIGPDRKAVERLKAELPPEARAKWEGKQGY
ncbi:MAG: hypothetical protein AB7I25_01950 [Vicinamibacterales bacterium]